MPKVRILSGSQAGAVVDLPRVEAEAAVDSGFAEVYVAPPPPPAPPVERKNKKPEPVEE